MREWWARYADAIPGIDVFYPDQNWLKFQSVSGLNVHTYRYPCEYPKAILILLHGLYSHGDSMAHIAREFAKNEIVAFSLDFPNHGQSEGRRGRVRDLRIYVQDVNKYINEVQSIYPGLSVFLLGSSLGGLIANLVALDRNDIRGMVLLAPTVGLSKNFERCLRGLVSLVGSFFPNLAISQLDPTILSSNPYFVSAYYDSPNNFKGPMDAGTAKSILKTVGQFRRRIPEVRTPVLLVQGGKDKITSPDVIHSYLGRIASQDQRLIFYEEMEHEIQNEDQIWSICEEMVRWALERT